MRKYFQYTLCCIVSICFTNIQAQVKLNLVGNNQIFYSSDWNEKPNYNFSFKAYLEIPISQKVKNFTIVPHVRSQNDDLYFEYISYNHNYTGTWLGSTEYYENGQFKDVSFTMDKFLFGLNIQQRIVKQLYLSIGYGLAHNTYSNLKGQSTSNLHYYNIDLAGYKLSSNMNGYYSLNLQYKFQILPKVDIIISSEYLQHQDQEIKDLGIVGLRQHSFH